MTEDLSKRDKVKRAEDLILLLRDIRSCRISTDEDDEITEIHVVADGVSRSPKLIARDVEGCLKAELDLEIDHRKIGVVIIDTEDAESSLERAGDEDHPGEGLPSESVIEEVGEWEGGSATPRDGGVPEGPFGRGAPDMEFLEEDVRIRFKGLKITVDEESVEAEVTLEKGTVEVKGSKEGVKESRPFFKLTAMAALEAVTKLLDEDFQLCLSGIEQIKLSEREAIIVSIKMIDGRKAVYLSGSAFIGQDANETAALAVLNAINRPFGRWKTRKQIHYRIR